jgi:hypothetical protein
MAEETYGLFVCGTKHSERTHLTEDNVWTLCSHRVLRPVNYSDNEPHEIPAASHWIYDNKMCVNCLIQRDKIINSLSN